MRFCVALTIFAVFILFSGCVEAPHGRDLEMLHLVFKGKATHKQAFLWFERTTYDALVRSGDYMVIWRQRDIRETRKARSGQSVRQVIADLAVSAQGDARFYFLVRGIGEGETIFSGYSTEPQANAAETVAGDLLVIDPLPRHPLFNESKAPPRKKSAGAR